MRDDETWFGGLRLDACAPLDGFDVRLRDCGTLGHHIDLVDGAGERFMSFPWWDHAEHLLQQMSPEQIPHGTISVPYEDFEQGFRLAILEQDGFVYVLTGNDPCADLQSGVKIEARSYRDGWLRAIERANADRRHASSLERALAAREEVVKLRLVGQHLRWLPPEVGDLSVLEELQLDRNDFDALPDELGRLKRLRRLEMSFTRVVAFPPAILELSRLEYLAINHAKLRAVPEEIGRLEQLRTVTLCANDLDALPAALFRLPHVTELIATDSRMKRLPELGDLPNIESIDLSNNHLPQAEQRRLRARYPNARIRV